MEYLQNKFEIRQLHNKNIMDSAYIEKLATVSDQLFWLFSPLIKFIRLFAEEDQSDHGNTCAKFCLTVSTRGAFFYFSIFRGQ